MRSSSPVAAAFCAMIAIPSACVIENAAPPPPAPRPVIAHVAPEAALPAQVPVEAAAPEVAPAPAAAPEPSPPAAAASPSPAADLIACKVDADCAAVPKNSCCNNGFKEAVNVAKVEAYKASFVCATPGGPCPMFRIHDGRTAACGASSHQCELVGAR